MEDLKLNLLQPNLLLAIFYCAVLNEIVIFQWFYDTKTFYAHNLDKHKGDHLLTKHEGE